MSQIVERCLKGNGGKVSHITCLTPIGSINLSFCSKGVHSFHFEKFSNHKNNVELKILSSDSNESSNCKIIEECLNYLNLYFSYCNTNDKSFDCTKLNEKLPSICWPSVSTKDSFTYKVLRTLVDKVEFGQRVSYKELASLSGNPNAQRAVGTVMRRNPIAVIIPCHRVVKSDKATIGNYNGGVEIKEWLLKYELNNSSKC
jgi:methylated-DNA-[protein]-cysteine S-methyltransferase